MASGLSIGFPLSLILSNIYGHYLEVSILSKIFRHFTPLMSNVQDCLALLNSNDLDLPDNVYIMNSLDEHIQFILKVKKIISVPFTVSLHPSSFI